MSDHGRRLRIGSATPGGSRPETLWSAARPLLVLNELLETRYGDLSTHGRTVAVHSAMTARELGLSTQTVQRIELAGTLHDVGKVDVDDTILRKPGPLTAQEWAEVRRHPEIGARLLRGAKLVDIADWVLAHHERVDGSGYPNGSDDREIPIEAKILSVCDAHDAMRTRRVYQAPMTPDHAVAELQRTAGTQFDEGVVTAFLRALDRSGGRSPLRSATTTVGYQASMKRPAVP